MMPHVVSHDAPNLDRQIEAALETGQTLIFPTDTVYGIGGNPWDEQVLDRVRALKSRPADRPFTLHLASVDAIERHARLDDRLRAAVDRLLPGPYTLLLPASHDAPASATLDGVVGVRVPDHPFFRTTMARLGRPLFGTSVNRSGAPPLCEIGEIIDRFKAVDLIVIGRVGAVASTILDMTSDPPRVVRGTPREAL
ncbi:L-threonylcarbamoyladenylate synthase [Candidatus Bipolaricaulota bacterium]